MARIQYGAGTEDLAATIAAYQGQKAAKEELRLATQGVTAATSELASVLNRELATEARLAGFQRELAAARNEVTAATLGQAAATRELGVADAAQMAAASRSAAATRAQAEAQSYAAQARLASARYSVPTFMQGGAYIPPRGRPPDAPPGWREPVGLLPPGRPYIGGTTGPVTARYGAVPPPAATEGEAQRVKGVLNEAQFAQETRAGAEALGVRTAASQRATAAMQQLSDSEMRHGALSAEWIMSAIRGEASLKSLGSQVAITAAKFGGWVLAAGAVYGVYDALKQVGTGAKDSNAAIADLSRFIERGFNVDKAKAQLRDVASSTNTSIKETGEAASQFARVFHNQDQAFAAAHAALILHQLDNLSLADSYKSLTAVIQGFHLQASAIPGLMDSINASQREFGANVSQIVMGFGRAAGSVNVSGGTPQHLQAMLATIIRSTGGQGANIGIAIGRAATRFSQQPQNQEILKGYGIEVGKGWDKLIDSAIEQIQRRNLPKTDIRKIAQAVGGPAFGARYFAAFFQNADLYKQVLHDTSPENAKGTAQKELEKKLGSLGQEFHRVTVEAQNLGSELEQAGVTAPFEAIATAITFVLTGMRGVLEIFRELPAPAQALAASMLIVAAAAKVLGSFSRADGLLARSPLGRLGSGGGRDARFQSATLRGGVEAAQQDVYSAASTARQDAHATEVQQQLVNRYRAQTEAARSGTLGQEKQVVAQNELADMENKLALDAAKQLESGTRLQVAQDILATRLNEQSAFTKLGSQAQRDAFFAQRGYAARTGPQGVRSPLQTFGPIPNARNVPGVPEEVGPLPGSVNLMRGMERDGNLVQRTFGRIKDTGEQAASTLGRIAAGGGPFAKEGGGKFLSTGGAGFLGTLGNLAFAAAIGATLGQYLGDYFDKQGQKADAAGAGPGTPAEASGAYTRGRQAAAQYAAERRYYHGSTPPSPQDILNPEQYADYTFYESRRRQSTVQATLLRRDRALGLPTGDSTDLRVTGDYGPPRPRVVRGPIPGIPVTLDELRRGMRTAPSHPVTTDLTKETIPGQLPFDIEKQAKDTVELYKHHQITIGELRKRLDLAFKDMKDAALTGKHPYAARAQGEANITRLLLNVGRQGDTKSAIEALKLMDPKQFQATTQGDADIIQTVGLRHKQVKELADAYAAASQLIKKDPTDKNAITKMKAAQAALQVEQQTIIQDLQDALTTATTPGGRNRAIDEAFRRVQSLPKGRPRRQGMQAALQAAEQGITQGLSDDLALAQTQGQRDAAYDNALRELTKIAPGRKGAAQRQAVITQKYQDHVNEIQANATLAAGNVSSAGQADAIEIGAIQNEIAAARKAHQSDLIIKGYQAQLQQARLQQAQDAIALGDAYSNLAAAGIPSYDPVAQARAAASGAAKHLSDVQAHKKGLGKSYQTEYISALAAVRNANQSVNEAIQRQAEETAQARFAYLESLTTNPIVIDKLKIRADTEALHAAHTQSERYKAEAQRNQDKQALLQDRISQREDDVQFALDMHKISAQQAIGELQDLLKVHNLSKAQRREIQRRIQSLRDQVSQEAQGFDLNVGSIKLPTIYDVRRAFDPIRKAIRGAHEEASGTLSHRAPSHRELAAAGTTIHNTVNVQVNDKGSVHEVYDALDYVMGTHVRSAARSRGHRRVR